MAFSGIFFLSERWMLLLQFVRSIGLLLSFYAFSIWLLHIDELYHVFLQFFGLGVIFTFVMQLIEKFKFKSVSYDESFKD